MIQRLATWLTQRALDDRRPVPAPVRFAARWHAPTRRAVAELTAVDAHLRRGVDHELAAVDASTQPPARVIPRRDASWWASGGAWAVGGVLAAAAGFALVLMWVPVQPADAPPTGATPPPLAEADRFDPGDLLERLRLPQTPEAVLAAQSRLAALQSWSPPRLLDEQGVAQSVALLGRGAEEPLRQEWDRLVAGVSTVVGQFEQLWPAADTFPADRDQSRAAPDPAASA